MSATEASNAIASDLRALLYSSRVIDAPAELRTFAYDASFLTQLSPHAPDVARHCRID